MDNKAPDYCNFLRLFDPPENAPDFILKTIVVDMNELKKDWNNILSKGTKDGRVRISYRKSKSGNMYTAFDTYHRDNEVKGSDHSPDRDEGDSPW